MPGAGEAADDENRIAAGKEKDARMTSVTKKIVVVLSVIVFGFVSVGYVRGRSSDDKAFRALTVYGEVLDRVQREYVDEPNLHQVTSGALHGLFDSLDPQSSYLSPLEYTDYKEKSAVTPKAEAGLALTKRFGYISVISALPDSPGQKAGLQLGDVLEKIAGFTTGTDGDRAGAALAQRRSGNGREALRDSTRQSRASGHGNHAREGSLLPSLSRTSSKETSPIFAFRNSRRAPRSRFMTSSFNSNIRARTS